MTTIEVLNKKIESLKEEIKNANLAEKSQIQTQIAIIEECEQVINDEEQLMKYDFANAIQLIETYKCDIDNLANIISDIQSALLVRKQLNLTNEEMPLAKNQMATLTTFGDELKKIKEALDKKLKSLTELEEVEKKVKDLERLKNILEGIGKRKYVTKDLFETFYEEFDLLSLPTEEAQELLEGFYQTRNLSIRQKKEKVELDEVIELYKEFLSPTSMRFFEELINDHKNEVIQNIDLDNTRNILQFFKDNNLLNRFRRTALLKISLYGNCDYIKDIVYPKISSANQDIEDAYFEDELATVWIKEHGTSLYKIKPFRVSRGASKDKDEENLYSSCHTVDYDEFYLQYLLYLKN